jgi:hypothetical protein
MRYGMRLLSVVGVLPVVLLGACATAPMDPGMDESPLALSMGPDVPTVTIHPTRVTVKNGRGETLLDGAPDKDNRLSGNPAPKAFDGTLEITTQYDNGTSKTQTLKHDPARSMSLAWDDGSKQYVVREQQAPKPADKFAGEPGWAIQVFGDYKQTPYGSTTISSTGSAVTGNPDLSDSMSSLGFGVRRYFTPMANGFQPFAYAGFSEYFGNGAKVTDVTYHFGTAPDTGAEIKEQRSFMLGAGGQFLLARNMALQLMLGLHATRMQMSVFSDETSGGGPNNVYSANQWMWGPAAGFGLSFPLFYFGNGSPLLGFLQYQAMLMDDVNESVSSPFTNFTYNLRADGGIQSKFMFGVEKRF